ncbi:hypothetical protein RI129_000656 [Pyrocoelia pectoralis]|uniref:Uncharacterized protein n=1 Tax=Pyrocoelia pectoralis TaxID=417401 RepID=A0AAN7ZP27_9COLE
MNHKRTNNTTEYKGVTCDILYTKHLRTFNSKDIGYKRPSPLQFDLHKKLNYYMYLSDHPYPKMNTTFEVRYFELEHDPPSKEIPHFKNMKVKDEKNENAVVANTNTKEFEISADAIEVRVFEFKRKDISEENKIMQKLQSKLHPQLNVANHRQKNPTGISQSPSPVFHNQISLRGNEKEKQTKGVETISHKDGTNFDDYKLPQYQPHMYLQHCAVNTAETSTRSFYNTTPTPVKLSSEEKHYRKCNFTRNKPKSAPVSKLRSNSNMPYQQFRELFRDNTAPWSDANSSVTSSELYTCRRNSITSPQFLNKNCEGFKHNYAQLRCRGGDSNFTSKGKICDSDQMLSTANVSVQCNFLGIEKKCPTESQKMMSTFCSNNFSTPRCEEKQLYDSNYMLYASHKTHKGRLSKYSPKPIDGPQVYACHKEESRKCSSSLCKPLIINNKFKSDMYKRFYSRNGINSGTEQDRDLESYKLKSTSSLCENKICMDNVCSTIFDNFKCAQTSDFYDKFNFPEKESSESNYIHQCFIDSDNYKDEVPTNIIYGSQSSLDIRNESITEYSKSTVNHYELITDNVTAISNPKIFTMDNYQHKNVYHINDNECYANVNGGWNEENQTDEKVKQRLRGNCDLSRYSIVVSSLSDAGTSTDNYELQSCNQNIYHHANDKTNKEQITKSNCNKSTQLPPITYRSRSLLVKKC